MISTRSSIRGTAHPAQQHYHVPGAVACQEDAFYFAKNPTDVTAVAGGQASLQCEASGPGLVYSWQQDGALVANSTRRLQVGSSLVFRRVDPSQDPGQYKCIATNASSGFALASRAATVDVHCEYFYFFFILNEIF